MLRLKRGTFYFQTMTSLGTEVLNERHVCQEPLFSLFLSRLVALPDG